MARVNLPRLANKPPALPLPLPSTPAVNYIEGSVPLGALPAWRGRPAVLVMLAPAPTDTAPAAATALAAPRACLRQPPNCPAPAEAYYGPNLGWLRLIKRQWDPTCYFCTDPQALLPAA